MTTEPPEKSKRYFQSYAKKFGERGFGIWAEHAYDSVSLVVKAMEKAGTADDMGKLIPALQGLTTRRCPTCSGPTSLAASSTPSARPTRRIIVGQWRQSQLVPVFADYGMG